MASSDSTTFSLAGKGLKIDTAADLEKHTSSLSSSTNITHIDFSGNTLGVEACSALAPLLSKQKSLASIDLHDIFTSRLLEEIPPALSSLLTALLKCEKLHTIDLSDNAFGLNTKDPLVDFLSKHTPLQHLILNNNGMGPIAGTSIAEALTTLASKKVAARKSGQEVSYLETVVCGRNRLENGSMAAWAKCYEVHSEGIRSVKMIQNGIRPEGIVYLITNGLSRCTKLEVLDMQDNTFTFKGASALSKAVTKWPQLKELAVGDDFLGARGSIKVFEALASGNSMHVEVLRLFYNDITPAGLKSLLQTAKTSLPVLRRVELNGNKFEEDDESVEELTALLSKRKKQHGKDSEPDDHWGLDELDELEGEDDEDEEGEEEDEDDEAEENEEQDQLGESILKVTDEAEDAKVSLKKDAEVDDLADALEKTHV
jgi:Ran GTPase-activating protein 1